MRRVALILTGVLVGCAIPSCCNLRLPNLGKCLSAQPCELLFALLGGLSL